MGAIYSVACSGTLLITRLMSTGYVPPPVPLRTKRNFKALVLPDDDLLGPSSSPGPTRRGGVTTGVAKKRPPPLGGDTPANGFQLRPFDPVLSTESPATGRRSAMLDRLAKLDLKKRDSVVPKLNLKKEDLKKLADLGHGNGGSVEKVKHIPTGTIMAKKVNHHPLLCRKTLMSVIFFLINLLRLS